MSLKKRYLKSKPVCKLTFDYTTDSNSEVKDVELVGSFNNWEPLPLRKVKGKFTRTIDLSVGSTYEFRYKINGEKWHNEADADGLVNNGLNSQNSVVTL